jgi:hypothetical protein
MTFNSARSPATVNNDKTEAVKFSIMGASLKPDPAQCQDVENGKEAPTQIPCA